MRKSKLSLFLRISVSLFLLYHLAVITVIPNPGSYVSRKFSRYLVAYANSLGINTTWQFFSPGPAPVFYLQYDVEMADHDFDSESESFEFPKTRRATYYDELYNRTYYAMRFFVLAPQETFERYFVKWLCKQHPGAESVSVRTVGEPVVNIERASGDDSFDELSERKPLKERQRFTCLTDHSDPGESHDSEATN